MTEKFKIGDLVRLKSGSPTMTIHKSSKWDADKGVYDTEIVMCRWFDEKKILHRVNFNVNTLELVTD